MYGMPFTDFTGEYGQHRDIEFQNLNLIAELKKERLLRWIEERKDDARVIANSSILNTYINRLLLLQEKNFYHNENKGKSWKVIQNEADYQFIQQHLKLVQSSYEVYDKIQIADAKMGRIIASTHDEDIGADVSSYNYFIKALHPANSEIFCIDKDPLNNQLKLFLSRKCQPHQNNAIIPAVVIIHVDSRDLINPLLNTKIKNSTTSETFLVNEEGKLLTALKYPLKNNSVGNILESEITLPFVINAAMGQEGITVTKDYRGEPVLAAYRHLRISPDSGWGLIVKKDQSEIFAVMNKDKITFLIIGISGTFLAFIFTSLIANTLSKPILHLSQVARKIKEGNWNIRANTTYKGEAGLLATTFNSMIDRIQLHHESLEKQVTLRTKELQETNDRLTKEIEDRKKSEDKLKKYGMLFDNISDLAYICDTNGNILFLNKAFEKMTGRKPETFFGKPFSPLFDEENLKIAVELYTGTLQGKHLQREVTFKDTGIICEYKNMPLFDNNGQLIGVIGVARDITSRKASERERNKLTKELEMKNEELERFTYTVSHDLKSPLLTIKGFLGFLEKDLVDGKTEQIRDDIKRIHSAANKMERLLEELLELSRIGRVVNKHEAVSLESLTREVLDLLSSNISHSDIKLLFPQNLPLVYVDRIRFSEVMQNLIENAMKYRGNQTKPIIEIGAKKESEHILCYVKDNGIGIHPRYHDKVFGLFERLDKSTDGTGIGLTIAKRIIEIHGGRIWLESKGENQGCTFYFTVPQKGDLYGHPQS